jgi:hypothetical protein
MAASLNDKPPSTGGRRRWWLLALLLPATVVGASVWLTEPLTDRGGTYRSPGSSPVDVSAETKSAAATATEAIGADVKAPLVWPKERLDGPAAKALALDVLLAAADRLNRVSFYTATFRKQERMKGTLGPLQSMEMKVRQKPFAVYLKFHAPQAGKEIVYAEGHHDNKVIAHSGGVGRFLVPRLAVPPNSALALADSRHPVTEAGLANLTTKLIGYRRLDLEDPDAVTVLDRSRDADGREWLRSVHTHPKRHPERPFARVEVLYEPDTLLPVDIRSFEWPEPGHVGDLHLAEHYHYDDLDLDASLTAEDFDPANPAYAFHRY